MDTVFLLSMANGDINEYRRNNIKSDLRTYVQSLQRHKLFSMQKSYPLFLGTINFKIAKNDRRKQRFTFSHFRKFCVLDIQYSIYLGYKKQL